MAGEASDNFPAGVLGLDMCVGPLRVDSDLAGVAVPGLAGVVLPGLAGVPGGRGSSMADTRAPGAPPSSFLFGLHTRSTTTPSVFLSMEAA